MPEKTGKPLTVEDLAPWPETEEDATAEAMAKHFAAYAQLHFRLGHDLSDRGEAAESARAFISFHDLAFLFREIKAAGVDVADRVAKALWESAEHPHTLGPDVWAWLEEYGIDPEQVNKIAAGFVAPLPLGEEPEPGDVWNVSDETVPIGGVAAGTIVFCPNWNDGRPVLILGNQDSPVDLSQTYVAWRPADAVWPDTRSARVDSDMQVTPCTLNGTTGEEQ